MRQKLIFMSQASIQDARFGLFAIFRLIYDLIQRLLHTESRSEIDPKECQQAEEGTDLRIKVYEKDFSRPPRRFPLEENPSETSGNVA